GALVPSPLRGAAVGSARSLPSLAQRVYALPVLLVGQLSTGVAFVQDLSRLARAFPGFDMLMPSGLAPAAGERFRQDDGDHHRAQNDQEPEDPHPAHSRTHPVVPHHRDRPSLLLSPERVARRCLGGGGAGCEAWRSVWRPWIGIGTEGLGVEQHVQDSAIASNGRLLRGWIDIFSSSYSLLVLAGTPPIIPLWGMWGRWLNPAHPSIGPWVSHAWGAVPVRATMR